MFNEKNGSSFLSTILTIVSLFFVYKYRYRLVNVILGTRWIRRLLVSTAFQIPYVRDRVLTRFMPF